MIYQCSLLFFLNDPATPGIYPLSLHDALPICGEAGGPGVGVGAVVGRGDGAAHGREVRPRRADRRPRVRTAVPAAADARRRDRKSTRLNSSHANISYAVFCLKKKKHKYDDPTS